MARVLIVGCGCRGQSLARALVAEGHAVRGTTRDPARVDDIAAAGAEAFVGDPDRVGTLMAALSGVTLVCHLLATASGPGAVELHGARLAMLLEKLVDTPVRGFAYEPFITPDGSELASGIDEIGRASTTWRIPTIVMHTDPGQHEAWLAGACFSVAKLLSGGPGAGQR